MGLITQLITGGAPPGKMDHSGIGGKIIHLSGSAHRLDNACQVEVSSIQTAIENDGGIQHVPSGNLT